MVFTVTHVLPTPAVPVKGGDLLFLVDCSDGYFRTMVIGEMAEMLEADGFYPQEQGRIEGATVYLLSRGRLPVTLNVKQSIYGRDSEWIYRMIEIYSQTGELIAQHGYQILTPEAYEKWSTGS